jgi:hypothetical protein
MGMIYLFSAGTLTFVRMIEMFDEIFLPPLLLFLVRTIRMSCIIKSPNS